MVWKLFVLYCPTLPITCRSTLSSKELIGRVANLEVRIHWRRRPDLTTILKFPKKKLSSAISEISKKSISKFLEMTEENQEEFEDLDSPFSIRSISMHKNSMAGYNREIYADKIIKTIAKETMIAKDIF